MYLHQTTRVDVRMKQNLRKTRLSNKNDYEEDSWGEVHDIEEEAKLTQINKAMELSLGRSISKNKINL